MKNISVVLNFTWDKFKNPILHKQANLYDVGKSTDQATYPFKGFGGDGTEELLVDVASCDRVGASHTSAALERRVELHVVGVFLQGVHHDEWRLCSLNVDEEISKDSCGEESVQGVLENVGIIIFDGRSEIVILEEKSKRRAKSNNRRKTKNGNMSKARQTFIGKHRSAPAQMKFIQLRSCPHPNKVIFGISTISFR